ncbi:MAG TPA: metalloregulator ArsR/SmtB family transcription factor [Tepidisphaeraceae bacterium]|jgi:ArsR family transcriptional regulator
MVRIASQPDALLAWMDCLADPMRLRLLRILERHELGVADLCDVLQTPQSTVSRHLKLLLEQGWVQSRRQGTNHLYEMILDELAPAARKLWLLAREQTESWATLAQDELRLQRRLAQRENDSEAFFAGAAVEWDRIRNDLYGSRFDLQAVLPLLPPSHVIADLGCGAGELAAQIAGNVKTVIGVDNSTEMLKAAKRRGASLPNLDLRKGDLTALPLADGEADAAIMILALTYVADPQAAVREMARVIKGGGRAVVVDLLRHDRDDFRRQLGQKWAGFEPGEVQRIFSEAGFTNVTVTPLPPDANARGPALFVASGIKG